MKKIKLKAILAVPLIVASICLLISSPVTYADAGYSWTDQSSAGTNPWAGVASSASGKYLAADMVGGDIYTSSDYGASWTDDTASTPEANSNWQSITSSSSGQYLAAVDFSGGIYTSSDYGASWTETSAPS